MSKVSKKAVAKGKAKIEEHSSALERLTVEYISVGAISPNPYNPNRQSDHDFELLTRSMKTDGFTQPVLVQKSTMQIVDGEHRWRCATALGYKEIPVVLVDMTEEQMRVATLRHNRARGSEDMQLVSEVLRDLEKLGAKDWAQDMLLMDDVEMDALINDVEAPEALAGEDFGMGWEPTKETSHSVEDDLVSGKGRDVEVSQKAADALREREARIKAAKTEQEREAARKDSAVYRLVAVFSAEEGKEVKEALKLKGKDKAAQILEWAREALKNGNP